MNKNSINEILFALQERVMFYPDTVSFDLNRPYASDATYYIDGKGIFTKTSTGKKKYKQVMFARRKPIANKPGLLNFFDIISPELYQRLSESEQNKFYKVVKLLTRGHGPHNTYTWVSVDDLYNYNFNLSLDAERLYTNKYKDEDKICYPCPSAKYHSNGAKGSLTSYFNKCYPFFG